MHMYVSVMKDSSIMLSVTNVKMLMSVSKVHVVVVNATIPRAALLVAVPQGLTSHQMVFLVHIDHDKCSKTGMCANGICTNMDGSFKCSCNAGFMLSPSGFACIDIDECEENRFICLFGRCENLEGRYQCVCSNGYTHATDGSFCTDIDECNEAGMCEHGSC
ncbi:hypothetical protein OTU49_007100, partial [Cherax quadricarinatus]